MDPVIKLKSIINKFSKNGSLADFQNFIRSVYGKHDDQFYSIWDLMSNLERFAMRALKGIRKGDKKKLIENLMVSFSWEMAIANRLHIELEDRVWQRFPAFCSYCGSEPCICKKTKPKKRPRIAIRRSLRPKTLKQFQEMFGKIYPAKSRTLAHAGVHFAEEVGEVSEAIHAYLGEHKQKQLQFIRNEMADFVSCVFGVANSAGINMAKELSKMYYKNCHACHESPCTCSFSYTVLFKS